jgi:elongation factor P--beta-lysine ligase
MANCGEAAHELGFRAQITRAPPARHCSICIVAPKSGPPRREDADRFGIAPASQVALARLDADDPRVALRFELYYQGVEPANGYHELTSGAEQRLRFAADQQAREARGLPTFALDANLLSALEAGLPDCAGVALGFDRVLMLAAGAASIDDVLAFPVERA